VGPWWPLVAWPGGDSVQSAPYSVLSLCSLRLGYKDSWLIGVVKTFALSFASTAGGLCDARASSAESA